MWKRYLFLSLWLLGMLAPMALLGRFSTHYNHLFNWVFAPVYMHVVSHAVLFAVLAFMLTVLISRIAWMRTNGRLFMTVLGLVILVALLQESLQLTYKARPFASDEIFDIFVDLSGACLGLLIYGLTKWRTNLKS